MTETTPKPMPVLFLGHGSPMNAIEDNAFRRSWAELAARLPRPKSVVCVSAHWETRGVYVTAAEQPETIHDFYGFPKALFDVRYPAPGDPALAKHVAKLLMPEHVRLDQGRGLDHGAWSVLTAMYPKADVPVIQLSLDTTRPGPWHYELARRLSPLRDEGVLILGSGNIVHNLQAFDWRSPQTLPWAVRFDVEAKRLMKAGDHKTLADYEELGPDAQLAVPSAEHFLPLLYALAQQRPGEPLAFFNEDVTSSISMRSVIIGS